MSKPNVAFFDFACCEGCQLQVYNLEEEILDLLSLVNPVEWREAMTGKCEEYDVAIIEGSITRPQDEEQLRDIRKRSKFLVALGACATIGGVNKLKDHFPLSDVKECVYAENADMEHLNTAPTKSVQEVVDVDYCIHGCPIDKDEFAYIIKCLVKGITPVIPDYPVCVECKNQENTCRFEYDEVCLGPMVRAGCKAACPSKGFWCFGCRGFVDDPNVNAARDVMEQYGKTEADLQTKLELFNSKQEPTNVQN